MDVSLNKLDQLEVICIETFKVYDFCFQTEHRENNCISLGTTVVPVGSTITCSIESTSCQEVSRTTPDMEGRSNVTFALSAELRIIITNPSGTIIFNRTRTFGFTKTVVICAPEGTITNCAIVNSSCGPCVIIGDQVCCTFDLCVVIQSLAVVKVLVPSFGFCTPKACEQVSPQPPIVCPGVLFPPQCPADNNCR